MFEHAYCKSPFSFQLRRLTLRTESVSLGVEIPEFRLAIARAEADIAEAVARGCPAPATHQEIDRMAIWKDRIAIHDRPFNRVLEVIIVAPDKMNVFNLQELAERAWQSPFKQVTVGKVTVKVRAFSH